MTQSVAILVIDDDPQVLRMLERVFSLEGFEVTTTSSPFGSTTLAAGLSPKLIIVDYEMPALKGPSLIEVMRRHPACQGIPVLIYSGAERSLLAATVARGMADAYVQKGESMELLIARARTLTGISDTPPRSPTGLNDGTSSQTPRPR